MADEWDQMEADNKRLRLWVSDLQSGMYINCVYCGHRYGPKEGTAVAMSDVLKQHVVECPEHPLSRLRKASNGAIAILARLRNGEQVDAGDVEDAHEDLFEVLTSFE